MDLTSRTWNMIKWSIAHHVACGNALPKYASIKRSTVLMAFTAPQRALRGCMQ